MIIFILGEKISKQDFSSRDIELLSLLARHSARVIHNYGLTKSLLKRDVEKFVENAEQSDDITLMVIHYGQQ